MKFVRSTLGLEFAPENGCVSPVNGMLPEREPHEQDGMPALLSPGIKDQDDGFHSKQKPEKTSMIIRKYPAERSIRSQALEKMRFSI